jgi:hypothetical protein
MINLILAQYERGKFIGFLELYNLCKIQSEMTFLLGEDSIRIVENEMFGDYWNYERDEKDPLNRFNGLFDGSTFGEGRFILIKDSDYQFFDCKANFSDRWSYEDGNSNIFISFEGALCKRYRDRKGFFWRADFPELEASECIGNIFENPELYEKIK